MVLRYRATPFFSRVRRTPHGRSSAKNVSAPAHSVHCIKYNHRPADMQVEDARFEGINLKLAMDINIKRTDGKSYAHLLDLTHRRYSDIVVIVVAANICRRRGHTSDRNFGDHTILCNEGQTLLFSSFVAFELIVTLVGTYIMLNVRFY